MIIEVCGPGCYRCQTTEKNVLEALKELGRQIGDDAIVTKVKDVTMFRARGVLMTPAVLIDGVKMCEGRIPEVQEIKKWLQPQK